MPPDAAEHVICDETVRQAVAGDRAALDRLATQLEPHTHRMVIARLSPQPNQWHAVEEIVQESLAGLVQSITTLERADASGLRAYLGRIVDHKVADRIRKQGRPGRWTGSLRGLHDTGQSLSGSPPLAAWLSATGITPRTAADEREQIEGMLHCLGRLKDEHRLAITYAFFDQLRTAEIAERMGITRAAASMLLLRAIRALRSAMDQPLGERDDRSPPAR